MATQTDKIQALEEELKNLDSKLTYYGGLFNADGRIDEDEKKKLDRMRALIKKAESRLAQLKGKKTSKEFKEAQELIVELENTFHKEVIEKLNNQQLQDYLIRVDTMINSIEELGKLESKNQEIITKLDSWRHKIHEEIERGIVLRRQKEDTESKFKKIKNPQTQVVKEKVVPNKSFKIDINDYCWTPNVTGTVEWGKESKKININTLDNILTYNIPWNTNGKITLNLSLGFSLDESPQEEYRQEQVVYGEFSVDKTGKFKFKGLNQVGSIKMSKKSVGAVLTDPLINFFNKAKSKSIIDNISDTFKSFLPHKGDLPNMSLIPSVIEKLKDQINKYNFSAEIYAETNKEGDSILIKTKFKIGGVTVDLSAAPFNMGAGITFVIPDYAPKEQTIGTINFEVKKIQSKVIETSTKVYFEEKDFSVNGDDRDVLLSWRKSLKEELIKKLTLIEEEKNTPKDTIDKIVRHRVREIFLGNKYSIEVIGFTSSTGSVTTNNDLGYTRAENVENHLIKMGFKKERIIRDSSGKKRCKENHGENSSNPECKFSSVTFSIDLK